MQVPCFAASWHEATLAGSRWQLEKGSLPVGGEHGTGYQGPKLPELKKCLNAILRHGV